MLALALAASAPLILADEKSWLHLPSDDEFRLQSIARTDNEQGWPFLVSEGFLACIYILGSPAVYFIERLPEEKDQAKARALILSTNPFDLAFSNIGSGLLAPSESLEKLILAVAPYVQTGARLCDQPQGAVIGNGEL